MDRWSLTRVARAARPAQTARAVPGRRRPPDEARDPVRLMRENPVLLLAGPRNPAAVERLVRTWNPEPTRDERGVLHVADGVRWHGPFRLEPGLSLEAQLPPGWSTGYAAQAPRRRTRIPDGRNAEVLRRRYPHDVPTGPEALAWSLVTGLARLAGGAARLPGCPEHRAAPEETVFCVYGHEALPWQVLRSVLELSLPDLTRNGAAAANDYCLERPGRLEVRVQPFADNEFMPYALRARADDGWPHTVYRFSCLPQPSQAQTAALLRKLERAALMLAEVTGGVLLDADGFPVADDEY